MRLLFGIFLALFGFTSFGQQYNYQQLVLKDYEEMEKLVKQHIALSRKVFKEEGEEKAMALAELKKGLSIVFMHPLLGTNETLLTLLRAEILNYTDFPKALMDITSGSLSVLQSSTRSTPELASHLYIIENMLSYIRSTGEEAYHPILTAIAKAKISVPDEVHSHRLMNAGRAKPISPSLAARAMLKQRRELKKKEQKRKARKKPPTRKFKQKNRL